MAKFRNPNATRLTRFTKLVTASCGPVADVGPMPGDDPGTSAGDGAAVGRTAGPAGGTAPHQRSASVGVVRAERKKVVRQIYDHSDYQLACDWVDEIMRDFADREMHRSPSSRPLAEPLYAAVTPPSDPERRLRGQTSFERSSPTLNASWLAPQSSSRFGG